MKRTIKGVKYDSDKGIEDIEEDIEKECKINIRKVPLQLRQRLKAKAAMEGMTMQDKVIRLIEDYVKGDEHGL